MDTREIIAQRFWDKVCKTAYCWIWVASVTRKGYGQFSDSEIGRIVGAHQYSWFLHHGHYSTMCVLHTCDIRRCVRPNHLFEGTHQDNIADMVQKGRHKTNRGEDHKDTKFTEADVRTIFARIAAGESRSILAKEYEVDYKTVYRIGARQSWKHLGL